MVPQREVPVAAFHIRAGTLEYLREHFGLVLELGLLHEAQRAQRPTRLKQRGPQALGKLAKQLTLCHRPRRGHTLKIIRGNEMRMHSVGLRRRQIQLLHVLPHIMRHKLNGRLHFGHHALRFLDPRQTPLA
jgi:hypothetical protein